MTKTYSGVPGDCKCECADPGCPVEHGSKTQGCQHKAVEILYRVDMEDETGVAFCEGCAEDALTAGVFATREEIEQD